MSRTKDIPGDTTQQRATLDVADLSTLLVIELEMLFRGPALNTREYH